MKPFTLLLLAILTADCASQKPAKAPAFPKGAACDQPIEFQFEDGHKETWLYPCWPEKNEPKCVKGCEGR